MVPLMDKVPWAYNHKAAYCSNLVLRKYLSVFKCFETYGLIF